jgi:mannose-6-phosphate isomerase-like protein (cupin superfamily)
MWCSVLMVVVTQIGKFIPFKLGVAMLLIWVLIKGKKRGGGESIVRGVNGHPSVSRHKRGYFSIFIIVSGWGTLWVG